MILIGIMVPQNRRLRWNLILLQHIVNVRRRTQDRRKPLILWRCFDILKLPLQFPTSSCHMVHLALHPASATEISVIPLRSVTHGPHVTTLPLPHTRVSGRVTPQPAVRPAVPEKEDPHVALVPGGVFTTFRSLFGPGCDAGAPVPNIGPLPPYEDDTCAWGSLLS